MEIFSSTNLSIPLVQIALLLGLSTLALIFGQIRLALLINYCFVFYWAYLLNPSIIGDTGSFKLDKISLIYYGFGTIIFMLALFGLAYYKE
jgi:hypothetical protein